MAPIAGNVALLRHCGQEPSAVPAGSWRGCDRCRGALLRAFVGRRVCGCVLAIRKRTPREELEKVARQQAAARAHAEAVGKAKRLLDGRDDK